MEMSAVSIWGNTPRAELFDAWPSMERRDSVVE